MKLNYDEHNCTVQKFILWKVGVANMYAIVTYLRGNFHLNVYNNGVFIVLLCSSYEPVVPSHLHYSIIKDEAGPVPIGWVTQCCVVLSMVWLWQCKPSTLIEYLCCIVQCCFILLPKALLVHICPFTPLAYSYTLVTCIESTLTLPIIPSLPPSLPPSLSLSHFSPSHLPSVASSGLTTQYERSTSGDTFWDTVP